MLLCVRFRRNSTLLPLPVAQAMPLLQEVALGVCGSTVSTATVLANSGKLNVALSEAFQDGELVHADAGTLVKMAKMKPL